MIRVLRAEIFKLRTTRLILGLLLAAIALVLLGVIAQLALQNNAELRAQAPSCACGRRRTSGCC